MGGLGSGRSCHPNAKLTTESARPLDIRKLQRAGLLVPGRLFTWEWTFSGRPVAKVNVRVGAGYVVLMYRYRQHDRAEWQVMDWPVQIEYTAGTLGGKRPWWLCPACGRRVAILYGPGKHYACRHCYNLAYESQREDIEDRATRRADRIRERLGWRPCILNGEGSKPKGMHCRTYERLAAEHATCLRVALAGMDRHLGELREYLDDL